MSNCVHHLHVAGRRAHTVSLWLPHTAVPRIVNTFLCYVNSLGTYNWMCGAYDHIIMHSYIYIVVQFYCMYIDITYLFHNLCLVLNQYTVVPPVRWFSICGLLWPRRKVGNERNKRFISFKTCQVRTGCNLVKSSSLNTPSIWLIFLCLSSLED
jgi:hypothetical protein